MKLQDKVIAAVLENGGTRVEPSPSKRYVAMDYQGARLWIGRLGAIRQGKTIREAKKSTGRIMALRNPINGPAFGAGAAPIIASGAEGGWDYDDEPEYNYGNW